MRVQLVTSLIAIAAIACATDSKPTTVVTESQNDSSEMSNSTAGEDDGERMLHSSLFQKFEDFFASNLTNVKSKFTKYQLLEAGDQLLQYPLFSAWLKFANGLDAKHSKPSSLAITFLTQHLGDGGFAKLIIAAKKNTQTKGIAMQLEEAQMKYWLANGKSVRDVYMLLKLNMAGDNLFTSPFFKYWSTYLARFNKKHNITEPTSVDFLTTKLGGDVVWKMIEDALKVKSSSSIAAALQAEQFDHWIATGKPLWDVYKLFKLDKAGDKLLEAPLMKTFTKFMKAVNKQSETDLKNGLVTIKSQENGVPVVAKYAPGMSMSLTNWEEILFQLWFVSGKKPGEVFKLLGLDNAGDKLISSPFFTTFLKFVDSYSLTYPNVKFSPFWIVINKYDASALVQMVLVAKEVPSTRYAANRMESILLQGWIDEKSPFLLDDIFTSLKLQMVPPTELFQNPVFMYWMKFLDLFIKSSPKKDSARTTLATNEKYNGEAYMDAIKAAQKNPETKDVAEKFMTELFKQFIFAEEDPIYVAQLLKYKEFPLWKKYVQDYNKYLKELLGN